MGCVSMAQQSTLKRHGERLTQNATKLIKSTEITLIEIARVWWNKGKYKEKCATTEDRDFREFFGCSLCVAGTIYDMLVREDLLPVNGQHHHLLWAFLLMKVYGKEKTLCTIVGGVDKKTFRKWSQEFVVAIADLESLVVSYYSCFILYIDISTDFFS